MLLSVYVLRIFSHLLNSETALLDEQVTLCAFDRDSDIAIFRSKSGTSPTPRKTLKFSDLSTLPTTSTHPKSEVIWTVGYAGKDPALLRPAKIAILNDNAQAFTDEEKKEISDDNSINTKFGLYLYAYKRKMRNMYEAGDTVGKNIYTKIMSSPEARFRMTGTQA